MGWGIVESSRLTRALRRAAASVFALGLLAGCTEPVLTMYPAEHRIIDRAAQDSRHEAPGDTNAGPISLVSPARPPALHFHEAAFATGKSPERRTEPDDSSEGPIDPPVPGENKPSFSVRIEPGTLTLSSNESAPMRAELLDSKGRVIQSRGAIWWSSDRHVASVTSDGTVTALAAGTATISASIGGVQGDARIDVEWTPITQLDIRSPIGSELVVGSVVQLSTVARDVSGRVLLDRGAPVWTSDRPHVASIDSSGRLVAHAPGTARIRAVVDEAEATLVIRSVLRFTQIAAGSTHTCAIASAGDAWCWGTGLRGELGIGIATSTPIPAQVQGGFTFSSLTAGDSHTCALVLPTEGGNAVCWGRGSDGRLGTGRTSNEWAPAKVVGGVSFDTIAAGATSTCGLYAGEGFCWGTETGSSSPDPVPALEGFEDVLVGTTQAAGVRNGELFHFPGKDTSQAMSGSSPDPVPARLLVASLEPKDLVQSYALGKRHACATFGASLATASTWCWGEGRSGQLGNGAASSSEKAVEVVGNQGLTALVAGNSHTCGLTFTGEAWCWGSNAFGQLGSGSDASSSTEPTAVMGPRFSSLSAGADHTCGISISGDAWCWGRNTASQLGDGGSSNLNYPVLVSSQH